MAGTRKICTIIDDIGLFATVAGALFIYFIILMALALPIIGLAFVHGGFIAGIITSIIIIVTPTYFFVKDLISHVKRDRVVIREYSESIFHVRKSCMR